jgi:hypothetical protein
VFVEHDSTMTISNSTFTSNTAAAYSGGAIMARNGADLSVIGCTLSLNTANRSSGAIWAGGDSTVLAVDSCDFQQNSASQGGGAIGLYEGVVAVIDNSEFKGNSAITTTGGAILQLNSTATVTNSSFSYNTANLTASVWDSSNYSFMSILSCHFEQNTLPLSNKVSAEGVGFHSSAITADDVDLMIDNSTFYNHTGTGNVWGETLLTQYGNGTATITNSQFIGNAVAAIASSVPTVVNNTIVANNTGSRFAMSLREATLSMHKCVFSNNANGAVRLLSLITFTVDQCLFLNNKVEHTNNIPTLDASITHSTFTNNTFTNNTDGRALSINGNVTVSDCVFSNNICDADSANTGCLLAALFISPGENVTVKGCSFYNNSDGAMAFFQGGGDVGVVVKDSLFYLNTGTQGSAIWANSNVTVTNCTIQDNIATTGGGGGIM